MLCTVYADSRIYGKNEYIWCCGLYKGRFLSFCSFAFCPNEGGEGPARIFCLVPFISAFLVNKRSLFPPKCQ